MLEFKLTPYQARVATLPEEADLALIGGRGGGKSYAVAALLMKHAVKYGSRAKMLFVRRTYAGLRDTESLLLELLPVAIPGSRWNAQDHMWRLSTGGTLELGFLSIEADFQRYQGRSFTTIVVDEAGQWPDPRLLDQLRSCLRGPTEVPLRFIIAANPGGSGHHWLARRYVQNGARAWMPFEDSSGRTWIRAPSTIRDNPTLDQASYLAQLADACSGDPELLRAWTEGDWDINRGAYFGGTLDEDLVAVEPWPVTWRDSSWERFIAFDYGSSAPAVGLLMARSPGSRGPDGRHYPRGSIVIVDEWSSTDGEHLERGRGLTIPEMARELGAFTEAYGMECRGYADDAIFGNTGSASGSIADEFRQAGFYFQRARKGQRVAGWQRMRTMLAAAGDPGAAGLYVSRACRGWWATVPTLPRSPRNPDDVDSGAVDHWADATRYGLTAEETGAGAVPLRRVY